MRRLLDLSAVLGLLIALLWAVISALWGQGLSPDDLARQPEAAIVFPTARFEREYRADAVFSVDQLHGAIVEREYRISAPVGDVVSFYRNELESRGWSFPWGEPEPSVFPGFRACARSLVFELYVFEPRGFLVQLSNVDFRIPVECHKDTPPTPATVAIVAVFSFVGYLAVAWTQQRRARWARGAPMRSAGGVARWGPAFAWVPYVVLDWRPGPTIAPVTPIVEIGLALTVLGVAFALWAVATLGREFDLAPEVHRDHAVVRAGPYRWVRHPLYVGIAVHLVGAGIASGNLVLILGILLAGLPLLYFRARAEEDLLRAELGSAYESYARDTGMFVPRLTGQ